MPENTTGKPSIEVLAILCEFELAMRDVIGTEEDPGALMEDLDVLEKFTLAFCGRLAEHFQSLGIQFDPEKVWAEMGEVAEDAAEEAAEAIESRNPRAFEAAFA